MVVLSPTSPLYCILVDDENDSTVECWYKSVDCRLQISHSHRVLSIARGGNHYNMLISTVMTVLRCRSGDKGGSGPARDFSFVAR